MYHSPAPDRVEAGAPGEREVDGQMGVPVGDRLESLESRTRLSVHRHAA